MTMSWSLIPSLSDPGSLQKERERLTQLLIRFTLIDSYHNFVRAGEAYPFVKPSSLRPGSISSSKEYSLHNSALIILVDGVIPQKLYKHFRARSTNKVNKHNISSVAPNLSELKKHPRTMRNLEHHEFPKLLQTLLPLDYALLIQRPEQEHVWSSGFRLTHFHVRIERLTDNALQDMGIYLHFLDKRLSERGEAFIEAFEKKYFEYFNFYHNAAGRKTAAALSIQLLAKQKQRATVFVTSQQDRRLTLLSSTHQNRDVQITNYILLRLTPKKLNDLKDWGVRNHLDIEKHYLVIKENQSGIVVLRVRYQHTRAALPTPDSSLKKCLNVREKWVQLIEEAIVPISHDETTCIAYPVAYQRTER